MFTTLIGQRFVINKTAANNISGGFVVITLII